MCIIIKKNLTIYEVILISTANKNRSCVVCGLHLDLDDDVVVCPVCGAPHHRDCWNAEGHCHYEVAHGTDLQWHPKDEDEEEPAQNSTESARPHRNDADDTPYIQQTFLVQCPGCRKFVQCKKGDTSCPNCGHQLPQPNQFNPIMGSQPRTQQDFGDAIDEVAAAKLARVVMQKNSYYLPRFRTLKKQGNTRISWNWMAFLLAPYWLAFRKCYLWTIFACCFDLLATILSVPVLTKVLAVLPETPVTYQEMFNIVKGLSFQNASLIAMGIGLFLLVIRALFFGLYGNYIYKKECLKRVEKLDAMPADESMRRVFRMSGISIFAPIITFYLVDVLRTLVLMLV